MKIHPFEKQELGKAPFRVINYFESDRDQNGRPITTGVCAYCGMFGLVHQFVIQSSEGKTSIIGSSCIEKTDIELYRSANRRKADIMRLRHERMFKKLSEQGAEFFNFGKYEGEKIQDVFEKDLEYILYLARSCQVTKANAACLGVVKKLAEPVFAQRNAEYETKQLARIEHYSKLLELLEKYVYGSDFVESMIDAMKKGDFLSENALMICCEISAKWTIRGKHNIDGIRKKVHKQERDELERALIRIYAPNDWDDISEEEAKEILSEVI